MNPSTSTIIVAFITSMGFVTAAAITAACQAWAAKKKVEQIAVIVDGHFQDNVDRLLAAIKDSATARGELAGRDFARAHIEEREDKLASIKDDH